MCLRGRVEVGEDATRIDRRPAGIRVDLDVLHQREVDHQTVIAHGIARDVVSASPDRDEQFVLARELDGLHDIFGRRAAGDQRRRAIDHGVPDLSHLIVARVPGKNYVSPELSFELVHLCFFKRLHAWLLFFVSVTSQQAGHTITLKASTSSRSCHGRDRFSPPRIAPR